MSRAQPVSVRDRPGLLGRASWVVLVGLNLALMPCALLASSDRSCPACPPESERTHPVDDHAHMHADGTMDGREHACDAADNECCGIAGVSKSERPTKPADVVSPAVAPPPAGIAHRIASQATVAHATGPPISPPSRRLHARYCVYLD